MKTVVVERHGDPSVGAHFAEMWDWLIVRHIAPIELSMVHILKRRVVFRASFLKDDDADQFTNRFGRA